MSAAPQLRDLPCLACGVMGREGRDVMFKIVEVPEHERREAPVLLPVHHASDSLELPVTVTERYVTEPRCRDAAACHERVLAQAAAANPAPPAAQPPATPDELDDVDEPEPEEVDEPESPPGLTEEPEEYVL